MTLLSSHDLAALTHLFRGGKSMKVPLTYRSHRDDFRDVTNKAKLSMYSMYMLAIIKR